MLTAVAENCKLDGLYYCEPVMFTPPRPRAAHRAPPALYLFIIYYYRYLKSTCSPTCMYDITIFVERAVGAVMVYYIGISERSLTEPLGKSVALW